MISTTFLFNRLNQVRMLGVLGLLGWGVAASGQYLNDPYQPDSSPYVSSSYPTLPNNLALPGQAREARGYLNYDGNKARVGTFERFVNGDDDETDTFGIRRGGVGVSYFDVAREDTRSLRRASASSREADQAFYKFEADRNRRYQAAIKEKDPAKRAKMLREVAKMRAPQSALGRGSEVNRKTAASRTESTRTGVAAAAQPAKPAATTHANISDALAAEAMEGDKTLNSLTDEVGIGVLDPSSNRTKPSATSVDVGAINARRQRSSSASGRPLLPEENSGAAGRQNREQFDRNGNRIK